VPSLIFSRFQERRIVYFLVDLTLDFFDHTIKILLLFGAKAEVVLRPAVFKDYFGLYEQQRLRSAGWRAALALREVYFEEVVSVSLCTECPHLLTSFNSLQELAKYSKTSGSTELNLSLKVSLGFEDECPAFLLWSTSPVLAFVIIYLSCGVERDMKI